MGMIEKIKENKVFSTIRKFYEKNVILKCFLTIVILAAIIFIIRMIPVWAVKAENVPKSTSQPLKAVTGTLDKEAGKTLVAESEGRKLFINTTTLELSIEDTTNGKKYSSVAKAAKTGTELALLSVKYLGEDNNILEWNSTDNCVAFGTYQIDLIENGVSIKLNFNEGESNRFYEYLPKKMSIEEYNDFFVAGINKAAADGVIDESTANRYLQTISLVYKQSVMEECYAVTYTGTPPASAVAQLIEVTKIIGYTREMLLDDAERFSFSVTFTEPANFDIVVEATLDKGELVVRVPSGDIVSNNDFYTIQNIKVLPNFGCVKAAEYDEGYFLIPDGSGALMKFNSYIAGVKDYERPIYDNDFYKDYFYMPEFQEELEMPVFGVMYGPLDKTEKGFLAIIEEGAENAYITARVAGSDESTASYNKLFASFDINQYTRVKIYGNYSSESANYLVDTGMQQFDCQIRYKFYGKDVTYYEMAKDYREYLASRLAMPIKYNNGAAKIYLEFVGAITLQKRFIGIPYDSVFAMTTFDEMTDILKDLSGVNLIAQYDGAFNGGIDSKLNNKAKVTGKAGGKKDLNAALKYASDNGINLYLSVALSKVSDSGNGFMAYRQAVRDYGNANFKLYRYMPAMGILSGSLYDGITHTGYYQLSPRYLSDVTNDFISASNKYTKIAIPDLAGMPYSDFRFNAYITGMEAAAVLDENLAALDAAKDLALKNPYIKNIKYGEIATDVSRESGNYLTFAYTIPFKQLVMNGLIEYTTKDVNISSNKPAYYVLQAAELGAYPKYIITNQSVTLLKNTDYHYLISAEYASLKDDIKSIYADCSKVCSQIGTNEIVNHELLADGVFKTTYANGVEVIVNYNQFDVTLPDETVIDALGYLISKEVGK